MTGNRSPLTESLRQQYDAPMYEALLLVFGENIHHGVFDSSTDTFEAATIRANELLAKSVHLGSGKRVLETACGVGGAARYLARKFAVDVTATNLSEGQLAIARQLTVEQGLDAKVSLEYADFTDLPYLEGQFDCYWCQDSWLYGEDKPRMISEAFRVLVPGGRLVFSDIVVSESVDPAQSRPFLDRINAPAMCKATDYDSALRRAGFLVTQREDWSRHLKRSLEMVCNDIDAKKQQMAEIAGIAAVKDTIERFHTWREAARNSQLAHVFFCALKPVIEQ